MRISDWSSDVCSSDLEAVNNQIDQERAKLTSPSGNRLNSKIEEFQRLEMQATFAQDVYKTALVALEKGRIEATRTIKKMSVVQTPSLPDHAEKPRRIYNSLLRSEEHTSELQSLMRISYAVFCLKKNNN